MRPCISFPFPSPHTSARPKQRRRPAGRTTGDSMTRLSQVRPIIHDKREHQYGEKTNAAVTCMHDWRRPVRIILTSISDTVLCTRTPDRTPGLQLLDPSLSPNHFEEGNLCHGHRPIMQAALFYVCSECSFQMQTVKNESLLTRQTSRCTRIPIHCLCPQSSNTLYPDFLIKVAEYGSKVRNRLLHR